MRKKILLALVLCVAAVILLRPRELKIGDAVDHPVDQLPGVTIVIEGVNRTGITATLRNGGVEPLWHGHGFVLETERNGIWYEIERQRSMETTAELMSVPVGGEVSVSNNWRRWYGRLPDGHYRIVKAVQIDAGDKKSDISYAISREFVLD